MVAWDNQNGTVNTLEEAFFHSPTWRGESGPFNVYNIGGNVNPPPALTGLQSFGMGQFIAIPEPSSLTLLGVGLLVALVWRRRIRSQASL
jgi:hypothetical protein